MGTPAESVDPYAKFGGAAIADPYVKFGGSAVHDDMEEPGQARGFWQSLKDAASQYNPIEILKGIWQHPLGSAHDNLKATGEAMHIMGTAEKEKRDLTRQEQARLDELAGSLQMPQGFSVLPLGTETAARSIQQGLPRSVGGEGDIPGAVGTAVGGYGVPAATAGIVKGAVKVAPVVGRAVVAGGSKAVPALTRAAGAAGGAYLGHVMGPGGATAGALVGKEIANSLLDAVRAVVKKGEPLAAETPVAAPEVSSQAAAVQGYSPEIIDALEKHLNQHLDGPVAAPAPALVPAPAEAPPMPVAPPEPAPAPPVAQPAPVAETVPRGTSEPSGPAPTSKVVDLPAAPGSNLGASKLMSEEGLTRYARENGITEDLAREHLTADGYFIIGRSKLNRALHGMGSELGLDHDALSDVAKESFGVKSMTQMSQESMLELYEHLMGRRSISEPLLPKGSVATTAAEMMEAALPPSLRNNPKALAAARALNSELSKTTTVGDMMTKGKP